MMKRTLLVYGVAYSVLLVVVFGLLFTYPKLELHMMLNSYHSAIQDVFFKYYSMLAEGPLYALGLLPLIWKKIKITVFYAICELSGGAFLQILKHTFSFERPVSAFENCQDMMLPLVQGVDMHHSNSFPSGHASTFFMFCTCSVIILAYYNRKKNTDGKRHKCTLVYVSLLSLLVFAVLGAYSRVYLSQHFLLDVFVGSIIGFLTPFLIFYFGRNKFIKPQTKDENEEIVA